VTDIVLEVVRAVVLMLILLFLWKSGHKRFQKSHTGWDLILTGFALLLFGSVLDVTDNFDSLNSYVVIGDTETEALLEKFVGFLGGFVVLAIGLFKWIPEVRNMSEILESHTQDLRDLQGLNNSLEKSRESFEALANNIPVFISLKDNHGRFQFVNKAFKEWVCVESEDIVGKTVYDIYSEDQANEFAALDRKAMDRRKVSSREVDLYYPDGRTRTVISTRFPVISATDEVIGLGTINFDISDLRRAEKIKQDFLAIVSHELRTPLTSIKGALGLVMSENAGPSTDDAKALLEIAYKNGDRLILLINDILDVEKIESGKLDYQMKKTDVSVLLDEAMEANAGYAEKLGISFVKGNVEANTSVLGDQGRLLQVLSNLMSNAAKFSSEGSEIGLTATREGDNITVAVTDSGPGIPVESHDFIFEKFTQIDSSDTRENAGTGLGLAISKTIIEQHGGTIGVDPDWTSGSRFYFTLPVSS
jgi:PAS domain S-box-containing protein